MSLSQSILSELYSSQDYSQESYSQPPEEPLFKKPKHEIAKGGFLKTSSQPGSLSFELRQHLANSSKKQQSQSGGHFSNESSPFVSPMKGQSRQDSAAAPRQHGNFGPLGIISTGQISRPERPSSVSSLKRSFDAGEASTSRKLPIAETGDHIIASKYYNSVECIEPATAPSSQYVGSQGSMFKFKSVGGTRQSSAAAGPETTKDIWENKENVRAPSLPENITVNRMVNPPSSPPFLDDYQPNPFPQVYDTPFIDEDQSMFLKEPESPPHNVTPAPVIAQPEPTPEEIKRLSLKPVSLLSEKFRPVFNSFRYFNHVQSEAMDDILDSNDPVVVSAPTGCGKTVIFELAIVRQLQTFGLGSNCKIVYIAPIKALCSERFSDWKRKFSHLGVNVLEMTGDSDESVDNIRTHNMIVTTPEKFDSISRWLSLTDPALMMSFKLVMIDEVHMLNDKDRGHVLEAVVSRLKTSGCQPRFIAVSATFPNVEDIALWLGGYDCVFFKFGEEMRPVQLNRVVLGYPMNDGHSEFRFEMGLSYKLDRVISQYSQDQPTLIFCNSRKSTVSTATVVSKQMRMVTNFEKRQMLMMMADDVTDVKLKEMILEHNIGYHHAGLSVQDKRAVEQMFSSGALPVLTCTSTLALGVNLPAQLVVIKSTLQMVAGGQWREYSESQILQMAGRAGRPQFCKTATVVIMTESSKKKHYEELMVGSNLVESSLHDHLYEHLNAEVILGTIASEEQAVDWVKSSYLYMRIRRNPSHYGLLEDINEEDIDTSIEELCTKALSSMSEVGLIMKSENGSVGGTGLGRLMSRYYLAYSTMELLTGIQESLSMAQLLEIICQSRELADAVLRTNEKKTLNHLNRNREKKTVRFQQPGKIKTKEMKVNVLIQASLGCMAINDVGLSMETPRYVKLASKIATCLVEVVLSCPNKSSDLTLVKNTMLLSKSLSCGLWEDSEFVSKQMDKVGLVLSNSIANAGYRDLESIAAANPRMLELAARKSPPFGNHLRDWAAGQPRYNLQVSLGHVTMTSVQAEVKVSLMNRDIVRTVTTGQQPHRLLLVLGAGNSVLGVSRVTDNVLVSADYTRTVTMARQGWEEDMMEVSLISLSIAGVDKTVSVTIDRPRPAPATATTSFNSKAAFMAQFRRECKHQCTDKTKCKHECCKEGTTTPVTPKKPSIMEDIGMMKSALKKSSSAVNTNLMKSNFNQIQTMISFDNDSVNEKQRTNVKYYSPPKFKFKKVSPKDFISD